MIHIMPIIVFELFLVLAAVELANDKTRSGKIAFWASSLLAIFIGYGIYLQCQNGFVSYVYFGK